MINQGDLDFVSPMVYWDDYGVSPTQAGNWVEEMVSSLGGDNVIPCIPGRGSACAGASYSEQQEFFSKIEGIVDSYTMYVHRYEDGKNEEGSNCFYDPQDIYIGKTSEIYKHPCSSSGAGDPCDHLCEIGDTRCESGELTRCIPNNDDCRVWGAGMTCASGACLDATQCLVCESGASYSCGADGNVWSYDSCGNPESISQTCGSSGYEGSNYCSNGDVYKDYVERGCTNASCYANSTPELIATCGAGGCSNGTCVGCTPSAYTACYDDDVYYYDSCDVLGDKALECGVSSYSGDDYCLGGNVVRDYVTRYCDSASCKEDMTQELQQDCQGAGCSNGACHPVCDPQDHLGCYNDDVFWYDSCGNRESKFEECGLSSWIGDPYCKNNDLYQEYTERGCSSASCYENTYEQLKEDCGGAGCDDGSSESLDQQQTSFGDPYSFYYDGHKIAKQSFVPTGDEVTKVELKLMVYYYSYADPCKWPHSDYETIDVDITTNSGSIIADNDDYPICGMPTEAGSNIGMRVEIPFTSVYDQFNSGETYWIKIKYNGDRLSTDVEAPIQWDRATYDAYPNGESWASGESETDDFWFKLYTKSTTPQCN